MISYCLDLVMEVQHSSEILLNWQFLERKLEISMVWRKFGLELAMVEVETLPEMPSALKLEKP